MLVNKKPEKSHIFTITVNLFVIDYYTPIRLICFLAIFIAMAVWEVRAPRRPLRTRKASRWLTNIAMTIINPALVRLILPFSVVSLILATGERGWGLLNMFPIPWWAAGIASILFLDLLIYLQHRIFHRVRLFWYLHSMHHTDLDIDVTTGARFHPIEIILSMLIKTGAVLLIGVPAWAFLLFEVLLNATSMFNHSNVLMPVPLDRALRRFLVTPDMHRVHHSVIIREHDSNYGFNLPWWDRLFGTYRDQPSAGHDAMAIGLANFRDPGSLGFLNLMALPFTSRRKKV